MKVLRGTDEVITLTFIPRKDWGGRGLLGLVLFFDCLVEGLMNRSQMSYRASHSISQKKRN